MFGPAKRVIIIFVVSLLITALAACQVTETAVLKPTIAASVTAEPFALATTTDPMDMPTSTVVPVTETATNSPPTITPTPTPSAEATAVQPTPTLIPVETEPTAQIFQELESFSPDGQWRAHTLLTFVEADGFVQGYQTDLTVSSLDGNTSWVAYATLQGAGLGYEVPQVVAWTDHDKSLFFTLSGTPDGCGYLLSTFHSGLYKLDLTNGEVEKLDVSGALSPDGMMVAHMVWEPEIGVQIHDLASQTSTTIALDIALERGNTMLNLVWSPDSQAIALEFAPGLCEETDYSLILLNLLSGEKTTLIWHELQLLSIAEWTTANEIYLRDQASEGPKWLLNIDTGERTRID